MAKKKNKTETNEPTSNDELGVKDDKARAIITVCLFIHLFVVFICLASNLAPSTLQQRMLRFFQPYAQLLNFDLEGTRYYLTQATPRDDDHRIEVLPKNAADQGEAGWERIARGMRGTERYHRYQRLAGTMAFFQESEETTALIAETVSRCYLLQHEMPLAQIRCRQHMPQDWDSVKSPSPIQRNPDSDMYFATLYRANVLIAGKNRIRVLKRADAALEATPDRQAVDRPRTLRGSDRREIPSNRE